eukprot:2506_1
MAAISEKSGCFVCAQNLTGQCISVKDKNIHKDCFRCSECEVRLVEVHQYLEKDGKFYCKKDFDNLFAEKCALCEKPVEEGLTALDRAWHVGCFKCVECDMGFGDGKSFKPVDGWPYCEKCYRDKMGLRCATCHEVIDNAKVLRALDLYFHLECFVCSVDDQAIGANAICHNVAGKVYCAAHFQINFVRNCKMCEEQLLLSDAYVQAGPFYCHPGCWQCEMCSCDLDVSLTAFQMWRDKILCQSCVKRAPRELLGHFYPEEIDETQTVEAEARDICENFFKRIQAENPTFEDVSDILEACDRDGLMTQFVKEYDTAEKLEKFLGQSPELQHSSMKEYIRSQLENLDSFKKLSSDQQEQLIDDLARQQASLIRKMPPEEYEAMVQRILESSDADKKAAAEFLSNLVSDPDHLNSYAGLSDVGKAELVRSFVEAHPDGEAFRAFQNEPSDVQFDTIREAVRGRLEGVKGFREELSEDQQYAIVDGLTNRVSDTFNEWSPEHYDRVASRVLGTDKERLKDVAIAQAFIHECIVDPKQWQKFDQLPTGAKNTFFEQLARNYFGNLDAFKNMSDDDIRTLLRNLLAHNFEDLERFQKMSQKEKEAFIQNFVEKSLNYLMSMSPEQYKSLCETAYRKYQSFSAPIIPASRPPSERPEATGGPYTYEQLRHIEWLPTDVPVTKREFFLFDDEFESFFQMTKAEFYTLRPWRQKKLKRDLGVF